MLSSINTNVTAINIMVTMINIQVCHDFIK